MQDSFGDRMKGLEKRYTKLKVPSDQFIAVRLDGKGFSRYTKKLGFEKPCSTTFAAIMCETARSVFEFSKADYAYTQSDEITLIFAPKQQHWFDGKTSKINSVLAAHTSVAFNMAILREKSIRDRTEFEDSSEWLHEFLADHKVGLFDCRSWGISTAEEAANVVLWRVQDCKRNAVSSAYRWLLGRKHMPSQEIMREELSNASYNWDNEDVFPDFFKYGSHYTKSLQWFTRGHDTYQRHVITTSSHDFSTIDSYARAAKFQKMIKDVL